MPRFDISQYETVEQRLKRFYEDHPNGKVTTELVSNPNNETFAMFKATLWADYETVVSTGYAQEQAGQSNPVNKTSHLENAETSAIGRALANWKYSGNKRPSREEMQKAAGNETRPNRDTEIADEVWEPSEAEGLFQKIASGKDKLPDPKGTYMTEALKMRTEGNVSGLKKMMEEYGIA